MNERILSFVLSSRTPPMKVMETFCPNGQFVLNRTVWRGKEARSCCVTTCKFGEVSVNALSQQIPWDIQVTYRPPGCITFTGNTKYDGWDALLLQEKDGVLLNESGLPLAEGKPPIYTKHEMYGDMDFNSLEFGEFVGEREGGVEHLSLDITDFCESILKEARPGEKISMGLSDFMAPHRTRPLTKIVLSDAPSGEHYDGFGTRIINLSNSAPYLDHKITSCLLRLVYDFIEGKAAIKCIGNRDKVFVELSNALVECTPNEHGLNSWFDVFNYYVPLNFLHELAQRVMSLYRIKVSVVDGPKKGLLFTLTQ
jgi:hypothetical protein